MESTQPALSRRAFLKCGAAAAGGLTIGLAVPAAAETAGRAGGGQELLPLVTVTPDGTVIIPSVMSEMGQGVFTSLPQIVAEELDADWDKVEIVEADADEARFGFQGTYASLSISTAWDTHRKAGAAARQMLIQAAAARWQVAAADCTTHGGHVQHQATGRSLSYGALAAEAAALPVPSDITHKQPGDYRLIGQSLPRRDTRAKVSGTATYGVDVRLPDHKVAAILKPPTIGAKPIAIDSAGALAITGVHQVFAISSGVAVVADHYWLAERGVQALDVNWQAADGEPVSTAGLRSSLHANISAPNLTLRQAETRQAAPGAPTLAAMFEFPLLAHATMEPVNFTARVTAESCDLWGPTQDRNMVRQAAADYLGLPLQAVSVTTTFLGGGFGRKADADFVLDAIEVARQLDGPVKVMWSRENDIKNCIFRPMSVHALSASLDADGRVSNWRHRVASHGPKDMAWLSTDGADHIPYNVDGLTAEAHLAKSPVPVGTLRGIAHSSTNFANEVFIDELAEAAGKDPIQFRHAMLDHEPRAQHVLSVLADKADWHGTKPSSLHRGVALFDKPRGDTNFFIAQLVEVGQQDDGSLKVERVITAADFGIPVNPDGIRAQIEGGIAFALSMALYGNITIEEGAVQQSNFHDYAVLRIEDMPVIETHIIDSGAVPRGCGEHINPATLPALANAVSRATGERVRSLPLQLTA